jgi:hypothetical protein
MGFTPLSCQEWHFDTSLSGRINNVPSRYAPNCAPRIATNNIERHKTKNPQSQRRNAGFVDVAELQKTKLWCRKPESNRHDVATAGF